jgi:hypothetical protein
MEDFGTYIYILLILLSVVGGLFNRNKQQKAPRQLPRTETGTQDFDSMKQEKVREAEARYEKAKEQLATLSRKSLVEFEPVEVPQEDESWLSPIDRERAKEFSMSKYGKAGKVRSSASNEAGNLHPAGNLRDGIIWNTILERPKW